MDNILGRRNQPHIVRVGTTVIRQTRVSNEESLCGMVIICSMNLGEKKVLSDETFIV